MNGKISMMIAQAAFAPALEVAAAEDVHHRAHPQDQEEDDRGDDQDSHVVTIPRSRAIEKERRSC